LYHSTGDAHAEDVHPSLVKIEQVRIEQRGKDVLHDHHEADPRRQPLAAKKPQVLPPHRIEHDYPKHAPLDRDVQCLIMWIADDLAAGQNTWTGRGLLEKSARRSGAMSGDRGFGNEPQRFLPE